MIVTVLILIGLSFATGFVVGVKNATSSKVEKAKAVTDILRK